MLTFSQRDETHHSVTVRRVRETPGMKSAAEAPTRQGAWVLHVTGTTNTSGALEIVRIHGGDTTPLEGVSLHRHTVFTARGEPARGRVRQAGQ